MVHIVNVFHHSIEQELNLVVMLRALEHDLGCSKSIATMNHRHVGGEAGKKQRFLHRRVSAADHDNLLPRKKKTIAGRARRNSVADELLFLRQSQPARGSPAGDNQGLSVNLMNAQMQQKWPLAQVGAGQMRHAVFRAKAFRLLSHVLNQLGAENTLGKSREVLDQRGHRELSTRLVPFDDQRFQISARRVQSGSVSGAAGSDDNNVASFAHGLVMELQIRWLSSDFDASPLPASSRNTPPVILSEAKDLCSCRQV